MLLHPHLTSFHVSNFAGQYSQPSVARPTLSGLVEFAQRCPRLHALHLSELDASVLPEKGTVPLLRHKLRRLAIWAVMVTPESESGVYMQVAAVLDRVFPSIDLNASQFGLHGRGWQDVLGLMEAMRVGRANGAIYADLQRQG